MLSNSFVKFEKLYSFLWLYRRSLDEGFSAHEELLRLSKEIAAIEDEEYDKSPKVVKRIIDVVRLYEFDMIFNEKLHTVDTEFIDFWMLMAASRVCDITNPTNPHQEKLIRQAKEYMARYGL